MPELFGHTRAHVGARHALITPQNHVNSRIPGYSGATAIALVSPAMGANVAQTLATFESGGAASVPASDTETFGYVMGGGATVSVADKRRRLGPGGFFFCPAGSDWGLAAPKKGTQVTLFQKKYLPLRQGAAAPRPILGDQARVKGTPFLGDPAANLQVLLPDEPEFDMAVNLFAYQPGGHLPFVEVHIMEHGLVMLSGEGVYRLEDSWYPVRAGDAIWMGPYCAQQWFVAMGKVPARYLYRPLQGRKPSSPVTSARSGPRIKIDGAGLQRRIDELALISEAPAPVVTRVLFSKADLRGREYVRTAAREAGLSLREDAVGNIFARWTGSEPERAAVASGSHTDAIPNAGQIRRRRGRPGSLRGARRAEAVGIQAKTVARGGDVHRRGAHALRAWMPGKPTDGWDPVGREGEGPQGSRGQVAGRAAQRCAGCKGSPQIGAAARGTLPFLCRAAH